MAIRKMSRPPPKVPPFNAQAFLDTAGVARTIAEYGRNETVFTQGDLCDHVMYIPRRGGR